MRTNFWLDVLTAVTLGALIGNGILLHWVLPHGSPRRGLTWLGFDRHDWGEVHFWGGTFFLLLVVTHVALHWSWVRAGWGRFVGSLRSPFTWLALIAVLGPVAAPLVVSPRESDAAAGHPEGSRGNGLGRARLHAGAGE